MKVICIGDSMTYGYMVRRSKTWINIVKNETGINIINKGINGDTTGGMLARFYEDVVSKKPKAVFIMGGANDVITGADLGTLQSNIMAMTHQAKGNLIQPIIGIAPDVDVDFVREDWAAFTDFYKIADKLEEYNNWLERFAESFEIECIDFRKGIKKADIDNIHSIYIDGLHLNGKGHKIMGDTFTKEIKRILKID